MASTKRAGLISLFTIVVCSPAFAQQGMEAQREACTPDAFRLCMSSMPDAGRVEGCLRSNNSRLSAACYAVFNPPQQQAETTGQIRDRGVRPQREVQRQPQRDYDQPRDYRRDDYRRYDGSGGGQQRDYRSRMLQPNYDD